MEYFGAIFNENQIETHYNTYYLTGKTFEPEFSENLNEKKKLLLNQDSPSKSISRSVNPISLASLPVTNLPYSVKRHLDEDQDFSNQNIQMSHFSRSQQKLQKTCKIAGYNSKRNQFEVQFDQNCQKSLANLQFRDDDLPQETEIKFIMIQEYNKRIKRRYQVDDFIIEHKLLDLQYQREIQNSRSEYEKLAAEELKKFMRFNTFSAHNELIKRIALEKQLKSVIQGMRYLRRDSNASKLKDIEQKIRQESLQKSLKRRKPRKIIHLDKKQSQQKKCKDEIELVEKLGLSMKDVEKIITKSDRKKNGESFKYKNVKISIVQKK